MLSMVRDQTESATPPVADAPGKRKRGASNKRVSNQKLRMLGWEPKFPTFQIGMETSVLPAAGL